MFARPLASNFIRQIRITQPRVPLLSILTLDGVQTMKYRK
jgi:hypothetical protein